MSAPGSSSSPTPMARARRKRDVRRRPHRQCRRCADQRCQPERRGDGRIRSHDRHLEHWPTPVIAWAELSVAAGCGFWASSMSVPIDDVHLRRYDVGARVQGSSSPPMARARRKCERPPPPPANHKSTRRPRRCQPERRDGRSGHHGRHLDTGRRRWPRHADHRWQRNQGASFADLGVPISRRTPWAIPSAPGSESSSLPRWRGHGGERRHPPPLPPSPMSATAPTGGVGIAHAATEDQGPHGRFDIVADADDLKG